MESFIFLVLVGATASAAFAAEVAEQKGFKSTSWAIAGFLFGPLALIAIAGMPDQKTRRMLKGIAQQHGIQTEEIEPTETKATWKSNAVIGRTAEEDFRIVSELYAKEGGNGKPDFKSSNILATTITLRSANGKQLGYFRQSGNQAWHIAEINED